MEYLNMSKKIFESINNLYNKGKTVSEITIKIAEENKLTLKESYNYIKDYNERQEVIDKIQKISNTITKFSPVNEYGIPMLDNGEEW